MRVVFIESVSDLESMRCLILITYLHLIDLRLYFAIEEHLQLLVEEVLVYGVVVIEPGVVIKEEEVILDVDALAYELSLALCHRKALPQSQEQTSEDPLQEDSVTTLWLKVSANTE